MQLFFYIFTGFLLGILGLPSIADAVHKGAGNLTCGNCHTMHNSQGNTGLGGNAGGSLLLLRGPVTSRAQIHNLCLQCHASNGSQADVVFPPKNVKPPKVYSSGTWDYNTDPFNKIGAGGNFSGILSGDSNGWTPNSTDILGKGHAVGATNVTPPGGDSIISEFSCTNCHNPHGTSDPADTSINIFRNLKVNATGAGANSGVKFVNDPTKPWREHHSYVGGVNGTYFGGSETDNAGQVIWPVYSGTLSGDPATDSAKSNSYGTGYDANYPTVDTMSRWCAQCHDNWHEAIVGQTQGPLDGGTVDSFPDWKRHSVNGMMPRKAIANCASGCHISLLDRQNYNLAVIQAGKGLPVTAAAANIGTDLPPQSLVYYLPYVNPGTCGSSPLLGCMDRNNGGVTGDNHKVFCLSCHFAHGGPYYDNLRWGYTSSVSAGAQSGNGIESNVGCQLCHNR